MPTGKRPSELGTTRSIITPTNGKILTIIASKEGPNQNSKVYQRGSGQQSESSNG